EDRRVPALITVTTDSDILAPDGKVSLREALLAADLNIPIFDAPAGTPGLDVIHFNIPGGGVHTIKPIAELPHVTEPLILDGYSQPGAKVNTLMVGDNATPLIEIDGSLLTGPNSPPGLTVDAPAVTVTGLVINRFQNAGLSLIGGAAIVSGNFIGTDPTGTIARPNGLGIFAAGNNNAIGNYGRNIISGNQGTGVLVGQESSGNAIANNYIGTT